MDAHTLMEVMQPSQLSLERYQELLPAFQAAMHAAHITTPARAAMWVAQLGHESSGLFHLREIHDGSAYEGRHDLGNTQAGDGRRFRGRGPIQITGRTNYATASKWAHQHGYVPTDTYFVEHPTKLEEPEHGFLGAVWYWTVARPQINRLADAGDLKAVTRAINGGLNGLADRQARYDRARAAGERLLPPGDTAPGRENVLDYPRDQVVQDTIYFCGPASVQTIVKSAVGRFYEETDLARRLGTHRGGTDSIAQFPTVLSGLIPGSAYRHVEMPADPPTPKQAEQLWENVITSIDAGHGVVANIVAPPRNYPRAVPPSTISPEYRGGTVYHYVAIMGYSERGQRRYWIADSGFTPYGYWISHRQMSTLIPPKGYAYSVAPPLEDADPAPEAAELALPLEDFMTKKVRSAVNPDKEFDIHTALSLIDRYGWEARTLLHALLTAQGLDPEQVLARALAEERGETPELEEPAPEDAAAPTGNAAGESGTDSPTP